MDHKKALQTTDILCQQTHNILYQFLSDSSDNSKQHLLQYKRDSTDKEHPSLLSIATKRRKTVPQKDSNDNPIVPSLWVKC